MDTLKEAQKIASETVDVFAAGWDEYGLTGIRAPYSWESVARACLDILRAIAALSPPSGEQEPPKVTVSGGALAGIVDALGGQSGAEVVKITDHEIMDMAISGQAYSRDGRYNFHNESPLLTRVWNHHEHPQPLVEAAPAVPPCPLSDAEIVDLAHGNRNLAESMGIDLASLPAVPLAPTPPETVELGLNVDMTDVDRLRDIATRMAQEIKDVGELRKRQSEPPVTWQDAKRLTVALNLCLSALDRHDDWCGHRKGSPGDPIFRRAEEAARAALWPSVGEVSK